VNQKKTIDDSNVENFYKSTGNAIGGYGKPKRVVIYFTSRAILVAQDEYCRKIMSKNTFAIRAISVYAKARMIYNALSLIGLMYLTHDEYSKVVVSKDSPWDKELSDRINDFTSAKAFAILKGMNREPRNWIQGKKAYEAASFSRMAVYEAVAARYSSLAGDTSAVGKKDINELKAYMAKLVEDDKDTEA